MGKSARSRFPDRKISETFLSFAEPVLQELPAEAPARHVENVLKVAYAVWNAVVFADAVGDDRYLADARHRMGIDPAALALLEMLISRKRALFGDDARLIGTYEVRKTADGFDVRADARDPSAVPPCQQQ